MHHRTVAMRVVVRYPVGTATCQAWRPCLGRAWAASRARLPRTPIPAARQAVRVD